MPERPPGSRRTIAAMGAWTKGVVVVAIGLVACQSSTTFPSLHRGLRLTTATLARHYGRNPQHVDRAFQLEEQGVNGAGLLMAFFQDVENRGAIYISDVSYALQLTYGGKNIECVSKIIVDDGSRAAPAAPAAPEADDGELE